MLYFPFRFLNLHQATWTTDSIVVLIRSVFLFRLSIRCQLRQLKDRPSHRHRTRHVLSPGQPPAHDRADSMLGLVLLQKPQLRHQFRPAVAAQQPLSSHRTRAQGERCRLAAAAEVEVVVLVLAPLAPLYPVRFSCQPTWSSSRGTVQLHRIKAPTSHYPLRQFPPHWMGRTAPPTIPFRDRKGKTGQGLCPPRCHPVWECQIRCQTQVVSSE